MVMMFDGKISCAMCATVVVKSLVVGWVVALKIRLVMWWKGLLNFFVRVVGGFEGRREEGEEGEEGREGEVG